MILILPFKCSVRRYKTPRTHCWNQWRQSAPGPVNASGGPAGNPSAPSDTGRSLAGSDPANLVAVAERRSWILGAGVRWLDSLDLIGSRRALKEGVFLIDDLPEIIVRSPTQFCDGLRTQAFDPVGNLVIKKGIKGIGSGLIVIVLVVKGVHRDTILCFSYHL